MMDQPLQVIALSAADAGNTLPAGTRVVLRTQVETDLYEPPVDILGDDLVQAENWGDVLLSRLHASADENGVAYVVPGHPLLGDETVQFLIALDGLDEVELTIVEPPYTDTLSSLLMSYPGPIAFVDSLTLGALHQQHPFASGTYPFNSAQSTVITNITSAAVEDVKYLIERYIGSDVVIHTVGMGGESPPEASTAAEIDTFISASQPAYMIIPRIEGDEFYRTPVDLQRMVARLRAPGGCPWDLEQTHASLLRNLIEETYELADAIESEDTHRIREELGDFILQAWLHAQIAEENGTFTLEDVVDTVIDKLVRRHPHVFSDTEAATAGQVVQNWETIKQGEREESGKSTRPKPLGEVPLSLPALMRAQSLVTRAFRSGVSPDAAAFHRQRAVAKVSKSDGERKTLEDALGLVASATANGKDLEALLRAWSVEFENSFAEDRPAGNPN